MKRWIVNAAERTVREAIDLDNGITKDPDPVTEFLYDAPTYADAMAAGQRRIFAEEALKELKIAQERLVIVGDRIEPRASRTEDAIEASEAIKDALTIYGFDVWREGTGLVVLGRLP